MKNRVYATASPLQSWNQYPRLLFHSEYRSAVCWTQVRRSNDCSWTAACYLNIILFFFFFGHSRYIKVSKDLDSTYLLAVNICCWFVVIALIAEACARTSPIGVHSLWSWGSNGSLETDQAFNIPPRHPEIMTEPLLIVHKPKIQSLWALFWDWTNSILLRSHRLMHMSLEPGKWNIGKRYNLSVLT
jgi:hypothetical protein